MTGWSTSTSRCCPSDTTQGGDQGSCSAWSASLPSQRTSSGARVLDPCCAVCCTLSRLGSYSGFMSISLVVIETSARYSVLLRCSSFIAQCDVGSLPWSRLDLISSYLFSSDTGLLTRSELSFDRCSSHLTSSHALPPHSFFFLLYIYFYENLVCSYFPSSIPLLFIFPPLIFSSFPSNSPASSVST